MNPTPGLPVSAPLLPRRHATAGRAFTLIELLTVIAIIGILAAIIIPVVGKVRDSARVAGTRSNARQIALAINSFASENRGFFPQWDAGPDAPAGTRWWPHRVAAYTGLPPAAALDLFIAPADQITRRNNPSVTSSVNTSFAGHQRVLTDQRVSGNPPPRLETIRRPSEIILVVTGQPIFQFNTATGQSNGAQVTFAESTTTAVYDNRVERLEDPLAPTPTSPSAIGYWVGSSSRGPAVDGGTVAMPTDGYAIAAMVDGSVRQFRAGEIRVRHINLRY